jgi:hypothetical protein
MAAYRVRLVVAVPNRWPKRKPVPTARWVQAVDRRDGQTVWTDTDILVCTPRRGELIGEPSVLSTRQLRSVESPFE